MGNKPTRISSVLLTATRELLRPLATILLRNGLTYNAFAETAKQAFIDAAERQFEIPGKKQTISRISTITGLTRKEVSRLKELADENYTVEDKQTNRAARVIGGWLNDVNYHNKKGVPGTLPLDGENKSFAALVRDYSGDMTVRAIMDELLRVGAIEVMDNGHIKLLKHAYIPQHDNIKKLEILGKDVAYLISAIDHNLTCKPEDSFFQRKAIQRHIPMESLPELKKELFNNAQVLLEDIDKVMAEFDSGRDLDKKSDRTCTTGVGVYYFEEEN